MVVLTLRDNAEEVPGHSRWSVNGMKDEDDGSNNDTAPIGSTELQELKVLHRFTLVIINTKGLQMV